MPEAVIAASSVDGSLLAVPLFIEHQNTLFFKRSVLEQAHQQPPTTLEDFFRVAEALKAQNVVPLAMPAKAGWTAALILFDDVLVAQAGTEFHRRYFSGRAMADAPEMVAAIETFARMLDYSSDTRGNTTWTDAVQAICADQAAMLLLPNFVLGEFSQRCPDADIEYVPLQGNESAFVFVALGFSVLQQAAHPLAAREFMKVVGSVEGQSAFNTNRHTVPARIDVPLSAVAAHSQRTYAHYVAAAQNTAPAYMLAAPSSFQEIANPAVQKFTDPSAAEHKNIETLLSALRQAYTTLQTP
jgi:glucose/mannose transport system substrate-binding protein